ncbi:hypothetical protein RB195_025044 [Necator americanus]|uniref:Uncharacterized protein n=1 Tax=Necator americanus TaxID=51031 RepID=A0ABR1EQR6_NECAM
MYGSETRVAPSTVMERLDCTERELLRRLLGYFWPEGSSWKKPPGRKQKFRKDREGWTVLCWHTSTKMRVIDDDISPRLRTAETDASTCCVKSTQHSFRYADASCYQNE